MALIKKDIVNAFSEEFPLKTFTINFEKKLSINPNLLIMLHHQFFQQFRV